MEVACSSALALGVPVDSATSYRASLRIVVVLREMAPARLSARGRLLLASRFLFCFVLSVVEFLVVLIVWVMLAIVSC